MVPDPLISVLKPAFPSHLRKQNSLKHFWSFPQKQRTGWKVSTKLLATDLPGRRRGQQRGKEARDRALGSQPLPGHSVPLIAALPWRYTPLPLPSPTWLQEIGWGGRWPMSPSQALLSLLWGAVVQLKPLTARELQQHPSWAWPGGGLFKASSVLPRENASRLDNAKCPSSHIF